ncbi:MAG: hypothetical protein KDK00_04160 [Rhodobacteraceae bacterium]|nr:hypothetical protein [Paracoccaceae bacterium]
MAIVREHELHQRRRKRNAILGLVLAAFVAMVFGITLVKMQNTRAAMSDAENSRPAQAEASE